MTWSRASEGVVSVAKAKVDGPTGRLTPRTSTNVVVDFLLFSCKSSTTFKKGDTLSRDKRHGINTENS